MAREVSCGVILLSPAGMFLARATGTGRWDIPKGRKEDGETALEAALRETQEETGLILDMHLDQLEDLGEHPYLPRKNLHTFLLRLSEPLLLDECRCSSFFQFRGRTIPETDAYAWVPLSQVQGKVGKSLWAYLMARPQVFGAMER
jgi:8-oxo-dGTP pyrophosphatase MutT (NUDIX family)